MNKSDNQYTNNMVYPSNIEMTQHTETPEMSERREKYTLLKLEKDEKIAKGLTIGGALTTAAMAAVTAAGMIAMPVEGLIYAGALTLLGGATWLQKKIDLDSMIKASSDQSINELASEMSRER